MAYFSKNYESLIGRIKGISEDQFRAHFKLYEGYVKKINEVEEKLASSDPASVNYSYGETSELLRRMPVPYNGMLLHELFFENLCPAGSTAPDGELRSEIDRCFGSPDRLLDRFKSTLTSAHGWALLSRSRRDGQLRVDLVEEHHRGLLAEQDILLAIDGWEHAYMIDYGVDKPEYIRLILQALDWSVAGRRFLASRSSAPGTPQRAA